MREEDVTSAEDALAYLLDCTLATVEGMALTKSRRQAEYRRQILIAQINLDWAIEFGANVKGTRAQEIVKKFDASVSRWTGSFEVQK